MPKQLPDINLLPAYEKRNSSKFYLFITCIIIAVLLYMVFGVYYFSVKNSLKNKQNEAQTLTTQMETVQTNISKLENPDETTPADIADFIKTQTIHTSTFMTEINDLLPMHGYLTHYQYGESGITIQTQLETLDMVHDYTIDLQKSRYTNNVSVNQITTTYPFGRDDDESLFETIPRYQTNYTIKVNKQQLKGEHDTNE